MRTFFKAQDGQIRLFWRLLSYAMLFLAVGLAANQAHYGLAQPDSTSWLAEVVFAAIFVPGILGLTYLYRHRLDRKPWSGMALPSLRKRWGDLAKGSVWLLLLMPTPLVVLAFAVGQARIAGTEVAGSGPLASALFALAGLSNCFVIGLCEELAIRGYVFQNLGERYPLWLATLLTGLIFGLLHFWGGLSVATVLSMAAMSTVFVTLRLYAGSIWAAIGLHTAFNWVYTSLLGFSSNDGGYGHTLLHIETLAGSEAAAAPVNPLLGDIGSVLPNIVACALVVLARLPGTGGAVAGSIGAPTSKATAASQTPRQFHPRKEDASISGGAGWLNSKLAAARRQAEKISVHPSGNWVLWHRE